MEYKNGYGYRIWGIRIDVGYEVKGDVGFGGGKGEGVVAI